MVLEGSNYPKPLQRLQLLFVAQFSGLGGAERTLVPLAQAMVRQGDQPALALLGAPRDRFILDRFPGQVTVLDRSIQDLVRLGNLVARADAVIATSELTPTYLTWVWAQWYRKPMFADVQVVLSAWIKDNCHPVHYHLARWIYPRLQTVRCVSQGVAQDLEANFGVTSKCLRVVYVPFDIPNLLQTARAPLPPAHARIFTRPTVVVAGRLTSQKRFDLAIAAIAALKDQGLRVNLVILGEGHLEADLRAQANGRGLADQVFFLGQVEYPCAYMSRAQAFLLSSDYEGFGRVVIEALAVGCPVVATDCPAGPAEILRGGRWGILVPPGDSQAMAQGLAQVLQNPQLAQTLCRAGPQRALDFDQTRVIPAYAAFLRENLGF